MMATWDSLHFFLTCLDMPVKKGLLKGRERDKRDLTSAVEALPKNRLISQVLRQLPYMQASLAERWEHFNKLDGK